MSNTALNDMKYNFEPLQLFVPSNDYRVDEDKLKASIEKSKKLFASLEEKRKRLKDIGSRSIYDDTKWYENKFLIYVFCECVIQ